MNQTKKSLYFNVLPDDTDISTMTQENIDYYKRKIPYINTLFTKTDLPTINIEGKQNEALISEVFEYKRDNPFTPLKI